MQAARLLGIGDIRMAEVAPPQPGPGEVVVEVAAAGICGTDRHLFHGEFPCTPPVTLGHEFCGRVTAVGEGVALAIGAHVTCDPNIACGHCAFCLRGRPNLCSANVAIGIHRDGGFAEHAVIPAHRALPLPEDLHPHHGAFCEPLACTLHGMDLGAPRPGERVIILGGGVIGLLAVQLAANAGAEVMLVTRHAGKRALALELGARVTAASAAEALVLWPERAALVVECAGVPETVESAPALTQAGGRIVVLGVLAQGQKVQIEPFDLLFREISLLPAFINPFTQSRAAAMIASGAVRVAPLITRLLPLSEAAQAIASPPPPGDIRTLIVPG